MKTHLAPIVLVATLMASVWTMATDAPPACKRVKVYGVSGCELLPDRSCPPGYHKEAVNPPDPRMKAPSVLMCVPDKPASEKPPTKDTPKAQSPDPTS